MNKIPASVTAALANRRQQQNRNAETQPARGDLRVLEPLGNATADCRLGIVLNSYELDGSPR